MWTGMNRLYHKNKSKVIKEIKKCLPDLLKVYMRWVETVRLDKLHWLVFHSKAK